MGTGSGSGGPGALGRSLGQTLTRGALVTSPWCAVRYPAGGPAGGGYPPAGPATTGRTVPPSCRPANRFQGKTSFPLLPPAGPGRAGAELGAMRVANSMP
eukprot:16446609-Heterocapsa_arctica.AAC.1